MTKRILLAGIAAVALSGSAHAQIVNVDSTSSTGTSINLAAGTYNIAMIGTANGGLYNAYDQFAASFNPVAPAVSGCNTSGTNCFAGFANGFTMNIGSTGADVSYNLTADPAQGSRFATPLAALAAFQAGPLLKSTGGVTTTTASNNILFTLLSSTTVYFHISDTLYSDNTGGVSLFISAVPEPSTWGMMILGLGMVGGAMRYRRRSTTATYA